jgi:alkanesulfonate monooxygenase SsuD/methylene tetrahydromethanopterin reductase-like flavin-dependent oxidoreductase (luciferase family)
MDIGVGLPTTVPGVSGPALLEWARRAESAGFSSLGVLDRLVYNNYEPLVSLAAAAAVTERIRLAATILIAAYRPSSALLAKQVATVDHLSGGRMVLGVAAGGRADDFIAAGTTYHDRGRRLDALLSDLRRIWAGEGAGELAGVGPRPLRGGVPVLVGGHSPAALRRAARHADGWIAGGSSATSYTELVRQAREAWSAAGRAEPPRLAALSYVSLGPDGRSAAERYLRAYYAFVGAKAERAAAAVLSDEHRLRDALAGYEDAGCDELILFPCIAQPTQVDVIAKAAL